MDVTRPPMADHDAQEPAASTHHALASPDRSRVYRPAGSRPSREVGDPTGSFRDPANPFPRAIDREPLSSRRSDRLNRAINIVIAASALVVFAPVLVLIAVAIKLTSRGPVLYTQIRVGMDQRYDEDRRIRNERRQGGDRRAGVDRRARYERRATANRRARPAMTAVGRRREDLGGNPFRIYKFRSMSMGAECDSGAVWATPFDSRVTPLGGVLRQLRLDELPQLINVLKGDMNIVGPRPERPSIFSQLRVEIPEYPLRQRARPGITGWAQIRHSYDTCIEDVRTKVRFDLEYLHRRTVWEDLRIMVKTIPVILFRRGGW